ncbi:MAG: dockerin type I domain-containing protein [Halioglobus sp.]
MKDCGKTMWLFLLLVTFSLSAGSTQIYVDSAYGSDNNDGTESSPFRTINKASIAADKALTGSDEVILSSDSVFREVLACSEFGAGQSSSNRLVIRGGEIGTSSQKAILQGSLLMQPINYALSGMNSAAWPLDSDQYNEVIDGPQLIPRGSLPIKIVTTDSQQGPASVELGSANGTQHNGLGLSQSSLINLNPRSALTFATWVKFIDDTGGAQAATIAGFYGEDGNLGWRLYKSSSGNLRISYSSSGTNTTTQVLSYVNAIPELGEWQFIVVRYDTKRFEVFMFDADGGPGVRLGTTNPDVQYKAHTSNNNTIPPSSIFPSTADFVVGADGTNNPATSGHARYDGAILFTEALTNSEIKQLALGWYDGSDNAWQGPDIQGRYSIKTWAAPRSQGTRSRYRLFENGINIMAEGQEANEDEVDALGEYFVNETNRLLYFIPSDGLAPASDDAIELTDATGVTFNPGIGPPIVFSKDGTGVPNYIEMSHLQVQYSAYAGIVIGSVDENPAEGIYVHDIVTAYNNQAGITVSGRIDDIFGERLEIHGNDHAGLGVGELYDIKPGSFNFTNLLVTDNRRQGITVESLGFGKNGIISNSLITGTRSDGLMSRGMQVNSTDGDMILDNITLSDNEDYELIILGHTALISVNNITFLPGPLTTRLINVTSQGAEAPLAMDNNLYVTTGTDSTALWTWAGVNSNQFGVWKFLSNQDQKSSTMSLPIGDPTANDIDGDRMPNYFDNCPEVSNSFQFDYDADSLGDTCDFDDDNDGLLDTEEDLNANGIVDPGETSPIDTDTDDDNMDDKFEVTYGLDPTMDDSEHDTDGDGRTNIEELLDGGNPNNKDTGDVSGDGIRTIQDMLIISRYLIEQASLTPAQISRADFNRDGALNISDLLLLQKTQLSP